jgi:hypothetical protein
MLTRTLLTPTRALRSAAPSASTLHALNLRTSTTRSFVSTTATRAAASHDDHHGHESHYDPPGGWLWGVPPGEKRQREGWEIPFFTLFCGGNVVAVVAYSMKEDTS